MMDRVRRLAGKLGRGGTATVGVAAAVLAAVVSMLATQGIAPGLVFTAAVAAVVIVIWNPWENVRAQS